MEKAKKLLKDFVDLFRESISEGDLWESISEGDLFPNLSGHEIVERIRRGDESRKELNAWIKESLPPQLQSPLPIRSDWLDFSLCHARSVFRVAEEFEIKLTWESMGKILAGLCVPFPENQSLKNTLISEAVPVLSELRKCALSLKERYERLQEDLFDDPFFSRQTVVLTAIEIGLILKLLDFYGACDPKKTKRGIEKGLGFSMPNAILRKQAFWNESIKLLVDTVNSLCGRRKREWGKFKSESGCEKFGSQPKVRDRAVKFVARLLHACYPDVWPDDYRLIKKRHYDYSRKLRTSSDGS